MHHRRLARLLLGLACAISVGGCGDSGLDPQLGAPTAGPQFAFVEDNGAAVGALIKELTIVMPPVEATSGSEVLFAPGEVTGPVVIEVTGNITVGTHAVPVTELLYPGAVMWFQLDGDLFIRFAFTSFSKIHADGSQESEPFRPSGPQNLVRIRDEDAGQHGLQFTWEFPEPRWSGQNRNDPGFGQDVCAGLDDNIVCHEAPLDRVSDAPPQGTMTVRVYQATTERVRIRAATGELSVAPKDVGTNTLELLIDVIDDLNRPIANRTITLTRDGIEPSGGHVHAGQMPNGGLSQTTVNTGAAAVSVVYTADVFGGKVELRGTSTGAATAVETVTVAVADLQELAASTTLGRVGILAAHPQSHFGTAAMLTALRTVADTFHAKFARQLEVNDISLPLGGKFDLNAAYERGGEHAEHREGREADVRTHGTDSLTTAQRKFIQRRWEGLGGDVHDETILDGRPNTESPHYHFRF